LEQKNVCVSLKYVITNKFLRLMICYISKY